jgi:hypothetical protein
LQARRLLEEAAAVVGSIHPKLTFKYLEERLCSFIRNFPDRISPMLYRVRGRRESAIEFNSKVIIRLAKHFNIKVPLQETLTDFVDRTTVEVATSIQDHPERPRSENPKQTVSVPNEETESEITRSQKKRRTRAEHTVSVHNEETKPKIIRSQKRRRTRAKQRARKGILKMPAYDKPVISQGNSNLVGPIEARTMSH